MSKDKVDTAHYAAEVLHNAAKMADVFASQPANQSTVKAAAGASASQSRSTVHGAGVEKSSAASSASTKPTKGSSSVSRPK